MRIRTEFRIPYLAAALVVCLVTIAAAPGRRGRTQWRDYMGGPDSASYSSLTQINRTNVQKLRIAWTFPAGPNNRLRFNPIVIDGVMYVLGKDNAIVAVDAATGKQLWIHEHDPLFRRDITDRGINYWENKSRSDRRLLFAAGAYLQA